MAFDVPTLAATCAVLLAAGYMVMGALSLIPSLRPGLAEAWPVLHMEALIVGAVAGSVWLGGPVLTIALLALVLRCGYEAARVGLGMDPRPAWIIGVAMAFAAFWAASLPVATLAGAALGAFALILAVRPRLTGEAAAGAEVALFPALPLLLFAGAGIHGGVEVWILTGFILVETFDSYALLGGKLFGRTLAFPSLSPKKTVEGLVSGAAMLMLTAAGAGALLDGVTVAQAVWTALFTGALAVAGDLAASRLKRRAGVKDYPAVLPHQGGLLDIADAWIVAGAGLIAVAAFAA